MKNIVIHGAHDLRVEERDVAHPGPGEVLIEMQRGGICGSDLHYFNHGGFGDVRIREPMILGHEVAGRVAECGEGVEGIEPGQLVAISPSRPCRSCRFCDVGEFHQCLNMRFYGSAMPFPHIQGAFRQSLVVDQAQCAVADGLSPAEAAMAEPLAVVLHATNRLGPLLGQAVLVTGCGPIGILSILAARRAGADLVVATDLGPFPLEMARRAGADITVDAREDPGAMAEFHAEKGRFDALYECSGSAAALRTAIPAMRPGGRIVQVGFGGDMDLPLQAMTAKELRWTGSFRFHGEFFTGVSLMRKGLIEVKPLVTHTFGIDEVDAAFAMAGDRTQAIKAQIDFTAARA
ncbi:L-idonate 5-dehydrogenase [Palleronia aestuarii]|uniref:L-idonate 5-dehydrogenase n=1 Tax=Palleronia aestuarii TaxID=568105 RepID=A0A2W7PY44_9RHOB|nr:L-idonate 5-dehydrogenase [Palleronia aestuarii]PZX14479.1 L-idonate 5-dehydrogenase [Palleronia aestuarii]